MNRHDAEFEQFKKYPHGTWEKFISGCNCRPCSEAFKNRNRARSTTMWRDMSHNVALWRRRSLKEKA